MLYEITGLELATTNLYDLLFIFFFPSIPAFCRDRRKAKYEVFLVLSDPKQIQNRIHQPLGIVFTREVSRFTSKRFRWLFITV